MHVCVSVYGRYGRPWARESRPREIPRARNRLRMRGVPSGRSVHGYVIRKVGRSPSVPLLGRLGRCSIVTENVTELKQDRPKQNRRPERQRRYLSFPYSTLPGIAKLGRGGRFAQVGRTSRKSGRVLSAEPRPMRVTADPRRSRSSRSRHIGHTGMVRFRASLPR